MNEDELAIIQSCLFRWISPPLKGDEVSVLISSFGSGLRFSFLRFVDSSELLTLMDISKDDLLF